MCWSSHHDHSDREDLTRSDRVEGEEQGPVVTPGHLRVSDAERSAVVDLLQRHAGEGRLTLDEFGARVEEAMAARTGDDLTAVLRDLPPIAPRPSSSSVRRSTSRSAPLVGVASPFLMLLGVLAAISLLVGHLVLWPLFIFMFCGFGARRRHGDRKQREDTLTYA